MDTINNQSSTSYSYKIDPSSSASTKTIQSNILSTNLIIGTLGMVKSVDKAYATIDDILNYTVVLSNNGNILLSDIQFKDVLPVGAEFVVGSVKVDGVSQPAYDVVAGFSLGNMIILGSKTVTFQVKVSSLPVPNVINNKATSTFNYLVTSLINGSAESNVVTTTIQVTNVSAVKSANVSDVESGDEIVYTVIVTNNGNIDATDVHFTDVLDSHLTFVSGSVTVNGTEQASYNPNTGFALPTIAPAGTVTVVFKAVVV